jgi:hypothetical protein
VEIESNNLIENGIQDYPRLHTSMSVESCDASHNYFDDWTYPDSNSDDIVDSPYRLSGDINFLDHYPHVHAYATEEIHLLTIPHLVSPNTTHIFLPYFENSINVIWGPSSDTNGHAISYDVEYSNDNGTTWISLATSLSETGYQWNTTEYTQGIEYWIRVVAHCDIGSSKPSRVDGMFIVNVHELSIPHITTPTEGVTLNDEFTLGWMYSLDSWNHSFNQGVNYSVFSKSVNDDSWTFIDVTHANYTRINPRLYPDGEYIFRVVANSECGLMSEDTITLTFQFSFIASYPGAFYTIIASIAVLVLAVFWKKKR